MLDNKNEKSGPEMKEKKPQFETLDQAIEYIEILEAEAKKAERDIQRISEENEELTTRITELEGALEASGLVNPVED